MRAWRSVLFAHFRFADSFQLRQVVLLAGAHEVVLFPVTLLPLARDVPSVMNRDLAGADDLELLTADDDRRALVEANAQHVRMLRNNFFEIVLPVARQHVLIDGNAL